MNETYQKSDTLRVGVIGCGVIGRAVCDAIASGDLNCQLTALKGRDIGKTERYASSLITDSSIPVVCAATSEMVDYCDVVVEAAPTNSFYENIKPLIDSGKTIVTVSAGALLENWVLVERAKEYGANIVVPTGALLGLDAVAAASEGAIKSIQMKTIKPLAGLNGAPFLESAGVALNDIKKATRLFKGSASEAIKGFPANLNVAVALGLAGIGPDNIELEIWIDPDVKFNTHQITLSSDSALMNMEIKNIPTENPKTGRITALSVIATLRKMTSPLRVGT